MTEYDLGPNGAQILAADLLAAQAGDVAEQLHALSGELMIVDTPGQVELFGFREASNYLIEVLGRNQSAIIYLLTQCYQDHLQVSSLKCYYPALWSLDWDCQLRISYQSLICLNRSTGKNSRMVRKIRNLRNGSV